jgi:branched-chain amino acid aminotransferase
VLDDLAAHPCTVRESPRRQPQGDEAAIDVEHQPSPLAGVNIGQARHAADLTRANFEAHDQGAETAILLDLAGFVTEGPGFNVFTVIDGVVASPGRGALEGITRLSVFELCEALGIPTQTRSISRTEIEGADEIFFSTTAGGIMPVSRLGSRILGNDRPGPISSRLRKAYWDKRREGWHATPIDYD